MVQLSRSKSSLNLIGFMLLGCIQIFAISEAHPSSGLQLACGEKVPCNSTLGLTCTSGKCTCINPETMKFNEAESKCEVVAGKPCLIENPVSLTGTLLEAPSEKKLPCVKNSECAPDSRICVCGEAFKMRKNECVAKSTLGEECFSSTECQESEGLICVNNSCTCDPEKGTLSKQNGVPKCVGKPGQLCVGGRCIDGAECVTESSSTAASPTTSQICQCIPNTFPTRNGTCSSGYGVACDDIHPCKSWLSCDSDGFCTCELDKAYDQQLNICVAKEGSPCNKNRTTSSPELSESGSMKEDEIVCVNGADCLPNPRHSIETSSYESPYECVCKYGYIPEFPQRTCAANENIFGGVGMQPEGIIVVSAMVVLVLVAVGSVVAYCCLKKKGQALVIALG